MKTVAVIFGSRSAEHDVSIVTAIASIIKPLELTKQYQVEPVYIAKDGTWYWDQKLKDISLYQGNGIEEFMQKAPKVHLLFDNGLTLVKSAQFAGRKQYKKIDLVFPATHGTYGEDGSLMGLLEMANVPYVGCDLSSSVIAMDKVLAKQVTASAKIPTTPWVWCTADELASDLENVLARIKTLKYPLFVKPARLGSSIGISKVDDPNQLVSALEVATHYDDKIIIEQGVSNLIELTLPIMGNDSPRPALLEKPLVDSEDFFDFDTKYINGGKKGGGKQPGVKGSQGYSEVPAKIPENLYKKAEQVGLDVYKTIGCCGTARIDLLVDSKAEEVYFNEVNPLPGSLYNHNWNQAGVSNVELVSELIKYAESHHARKQKLNTTFSTNFLKQF